MPSQNVFHGPAFFASRGTTQGSLVYLTILNAVVDNVIRTWLSMIVEEQRVDHDGLGDTAGRCLGVFYANDGMVGSRYADWLQHLMNVLVGLLRRYGLTANVAKLLTMMCQTGSLLSGMAEEAKALNCMGVGDSNQVRL